MSDLTAQGEGAPLGFRIIVHGRVLDENAQPVRNTLVEVWQANAAGRYRHRRDQWNAPLDPIFNATPDANARNRLIARLDWANTVPDFAHAFEFDIVLRGREATPMEAHGSGK